MPLEWDLTAISGSESLCYAEDGKDADGKQLYSLNPVTHALIIHQMTTFTGGKITEENCDEVFRRIWILEHAFSPMLVNAGGPRYITLADVRAHIGLVTNCWGRNHGKRAFKEHVCRNLFDDADREIRRQTQDIKDGIDKMRETVEKEARP